MHDAEMLCLDTNDLFESNICEALDRQLPRDFFELYMYLKQFSYTRELHQTFIVYLPGSKRPIPELIRPNLLNMEPMYKAQVEGMTSTNISCKILEETQTKIFEIIPASFTDTEKEFLISFKSGEPKWDLFPIKNVQHFPSVKWKLHNIQTLAPLKK